MGIELSPPGPEWTLIERLPDPHILLRPIRDGDGRVSGAQLVAVNTAAGRELRERGGVSIGDDLLTKGDHCWTSLTRECLPAISRGEPFVGNELESCGPDGARQLVDVRGVSVADDYLLTWRDVTSFAEELAAIRTGRNTLRQALDALPDPYALLEPVRDATGLTQDFTVADLNLAAAAHAGGDRAALVGQRLSSLVPPRAVPFLLTVAAPVADARSNSSADGVSFDDTGGTRLFDVRAVPVGSRVALTWRDVTERERTNRRLAESEEHFRLLADNASDIVFRGTPDATLSWVSPSILEVLGYKPQDVVGLPAIELVHPEDRSVVPGNVTRAPEADTWSYEGRFLTAAGGSRWMSVTARAVLHNDGSVRAWVGAARDIEEQHRAQQALADSEQRFRLLAENSSDIVMLVKGGVVTWISPAVSLELGGEPEDWVGRPVRDMTHPSDVARLNRISTALEDHASVAGRGRIRDFAGNFRWIEVTARAYLNGNGAKDGYLASLRVVDEKVAREDELRRLARFDDLTGALKRSEAVKHLSHLIRDRRGPELRSAVLFIDLDYFKDVNDTAGHAAGDEFLVTFADRVRKVIRSDDLLARVGGDEFLVILDRVRSADEAVAIAEKIREQAAVPVDSAVGVLTSSVSIGVTLVRPGDDVDLILARADEAMYEGKRGGRDQVICFDDDRRV